MRNFCFANLIFAGTVAFFSTRTLGQTKPASANDTFNQACFQSIQNRGETESRAHDACAEISQFSFGIGKPSTNPVVDFDPKWIGVADGSIDQQINYSVFREPVQFSRFGFCYFVFKKLFDPKKIGAYELPRLSTGFSIAATELKGYPAWLKTPAGLQCAAQVKAQIGEPLLDPTLLLANKPIGIALNPIGALHNFSTPAEVKHELQVTLAHERIQAVVLICPTFAKWVNDRWAKLTVTTKQNLKTTYPEYNWDDAATGARQSLAFEYESKPLELLPQMKDCRF